MYNDFLIKMEYIQLRYFIPLSTISHKLSTLQDQFGH